MHSLWRSSRVGAAQAGAAGSGTPGDDSARQQPPEQPPEQPLGVTAEYDAIAAVQQKLLSRLEGARQALSPPGGAASRDELAEVVEELRHSGAVLCTLKKELDSIFLRLRSLRRALQAAFPDHAAEGGGDAAGARQAELNPAGEGLATEAGTAGGARAAGGATAGAEGAESPNALRPPSTAATHGQAAQAAPADDAEAAQDVQSLHLAPVFLEGRSREDEQNQSAGRQGQCSAQRADQEQQADVHR